MRLSCNIKINDPYSSNGSPAISLSNGIYKLFSMCLPRLAPLRHADWRPARGLIWLVSLSLWLPLPALAVRPTPPAAPSALSATAVSASQINLNWQDNSGNESGFYVQRGTTSAGPWSQIAAVGVNVRTYSNTGLSVSTQYYFRMRANNAGGVSMSRRFSSEIRPMGTVTAASPQ